MLKILAIDPSTHAGWALFEGEMGSTPRLQEHGLVESGAGVASYGAYPFNYLLASKAVVDRLVDIFFRVQPHIVVLEDSNLGKNRYAQKLLEFIHCSLLKRLEGLAPVVYFSSSSWRQALDLRMDSEQRKNNAKIAKAKKLAKEKGLSISAAKKQLGVKGKITKKHLSVNRVNEVYGLNFKMKDNDQADAICLGLAFFAGAVRSDGIL